LAWRLRREMCITAFQEAAMSMSISLIALVASFFFLGQADDRVDLGVFNGQSTTGQLCTIVDTDADFDAYEEATERAWAAAEEAATYVGCRGLTAVASTTNHARKTSKNGADCVESFAARFECHVEPMVVTLQR
jgi:hypothetical protein